MAGTQGIEPRPRDLESHWSPQPGTLNLYGGRQGNRTLYAFDTPRYSTPFLPMEESTLERLMGFKPILTGWKPVVLSLDTINAWSRERGTIPYLVGTNHLFYPFELSRLNIVLPLSYNGMG